MTTQLTPGGNQTLQRFSGKVVIRHNNDNAIDVNLTAFLITEAGKVTGDHDMVFYNQPRDAKGAALFNEPVIHAESKIHQIDFDLQKLPSDICKIAISLTEDKNLGFSAVKDLQAEVHTGSDIICLKPDVFTNEQGIIVLELYIRNEQPKARAVWQGFASGLSGLCSFYGVEVDAEPVAAPAPAAVTPAPGINLQKVSGKVDLGKGQKPVVIAKTPQVTASISWRSGTDYDIYAMVMTKDGRQVDVAMFGAEGVPPLQDYGNGAVKHLGDVGRDSGPTKCEKISIRFTDDILAVVPVAYSAQSNGTGSFHQYQVSMLIDNHQGTCVTIPAENASKAQNIFTCVPGMIVNTADGLVIHPLEYYSKTNSERRPRLELDKEGNVLVKMNEGPINSYK